MVTTNSWLPLLLLYLELDVYDLSTLEIDVKYLAKQPRNQRPLIFMNRIINKNPSIATLLYMLNHL